MEKLAKIPLERFSGEWKSPILNNSNGSIFISPSLQSENPTNEILVASVETSSNSGDTYNVYIDNQPPNQRPFLLGPPAASGRVYPPDVTDPDYLPVFNDQFTLLGTSKSNISAVMHDTVTLEDTFIFY